MLRRDSVDINCIAFPDDGAAKRFSYMFKDLGYDIVTCGKVSLFVREVVLCARKLTCVWHLFDYPGAGWS